MHLGTGILCREADINVPVTMFGTAGSVELNFPQQNCISYRGQFELIFRNKND